jgi:hypothetical protein
MLSPAEHVIHMREMRNAYKISGGKTHCGKLRHTDRVNIKFFLGEINSDGVDWIQLARDRVQ